MSAISGTSCTNQQWQQCRGRVEYRALRGAVRISFKMIILNSHSIISGMTATDACCFFVAFRRRLCEVFIFPFQLLAFSRRRVESTFQRQQPFCVQRFFPSTFFFCAEKWLDADAPREIAKAYSDARWHHPVSSSNFTVVFSAPVCWKVLRCRGKIAHTPATEMVPTLLNLCRVRGEARFEGFKTKHGRVKWDRRPFSPFISTTTRSVGSD